MKMTCTPLKKIGFFRLRVFRPREARKIERRINSLDLIQRHSKYWIRSKSALEKLIWSTLRKHEFQSYPKEYISIPGKH